MSNDARRLGILVPSADEVVEVDFQRHLPDGVVYYASRSNQKCFDGSRTGLDNIIAGADGAAESLSHAKPELICFCCTSASFIHGTGWDRDLAERLAKAAGGIPVTTTASALLDAIQAIHARAIFMVTPYPEAVYRIEIEFFRKGGIEVKDHSHFERYGSQAATIRPEEIVAKARENRDRILACDAVFFSCTNVRSMQVAEQIEAEIGRPVITSNQATMWLALGRLGLDARAVQKGRLFATPYPGGQLR